MTSQTITNKEKYNQAFVECFSIEDASTLENLAYNENPAWDSIGHMTLMAALEEGFNIVMETDDILNFSSYKKGLEIMEKYGIEF